MTRLDSTVRAMARVPQRLLIGAVQFYRLFLSAWLGSQCRFEPTCSRYALEALERHGAATGSYLAARRILRCSPLCDGGCDPVPDAPGTRPGQAGALFHFLRSSRSSRSSRLPSRTTTQP